MKWFYRLTIAGLVAYAALFFTVYRPLLPGYHLCRYNAAHYEAEKHSIARRRAGCTNITEARQLFTRTLCEQIFPYWYGTHRNFYGNTETPGSGSIACGYFVTTVLRDAGVRLQRNALAQCASEQMISSLVDKPYIKHCINYTLPAFIKALRQQGEGMYVVGLDNHTGFIRVEKDQVRFIHASGRFPFAVVNEDATHSEVLAASRYKVTGCLSNPAFLEQWLAAR